MSDAKAQKDIEWDRRDDQRCPRCGSLNPSPTDEVFSDDGDSWWVGISCGACGYYNDGDKVWDDAPFILPGDPGSYDTMADYAGDDPTPGTREENVA